MNATSSKLFARGHELDSSETAFGKLRRSDDVELDPVALRERFAEDGYLYIPEFYAREEIAAARQHILQELEERKLLDPAFPLGDGVKKADADLSFQSEPRLAVDFMKKVARTNLAMRRLLYDGKLIASFEAFFGEGVRHFDFTWVRLMGKGFGTEPHCDTVYMGRGSSRLCTAWTPYGDLTHEIGGLMILEGSHREGDQLRNYLRRDVDVYCENRPEAERIKSGEIPWKWNGVLSGNPKVLRERLGGRWLTSEYRMGDLLVFGMRTVHASLGRVFKPWNHGRRSQS